MKLRSSYLSQIFSIVLISSLMSSVSFADVTKEIFEKTIENIHLLYTNNVDSGINLEISGSWNDDQSNAYAAKADSQYRVYVSGGLARNTNITQDALALIICHELGHLFGGAPYPNTLKIATSVEGQSDYYATKNCLADVFKVLPPNENAIDQITPNMKNLCLDYMGESHTCLRALVSMQNSANYMSRNLPLPKPSLDISDPFEAERTLLDYPNTVQCRLDTLKAGLFNKPRPRCWFNEENTWIFNHDVFPPRLEKVD